MTLPGITALIGATTRLLAPIKSVLIAACGVAAMAYLALFVAVTFGIDLCDRLAARVRARRGRRAWPPAGGRPA